MIVAIYIEKYEDLIDKPQTINLGGKFLYKFQKEGDDTIIVSRENNPQYVEGFFNISDSDCKVDLVSAIVGENGVGKTRLIDIIINQPQKKDYIIIYEEFDSIIIQNETYKQINKDKNIKNKERILSKWYCSDSKNKLYYSPFFNGKVASKALESGINLSPEYVYKKNFNKKIESYEMLSTLLFQRQIEFVSSDLFINNISNIFFKYNKPHENIALNDQYPTQQKDKYLYKIKYDLISKLKGESKNNLNNKEAIYNYILFSIIYSLSKKWEINVDEIESVNKLSLDELLFHIIIKYFQKGDYKELKHIVNELNVEISKNDFILLSYESTYLEGIENYEYETDNIKILTSLRMSKESVLLIDKLYTNTIRKIYEVNNKRISDNDILSIKNNGTLSINPIYNLSGGEEAILNILSQIYFYINKDLKKIISRGQEKFFLFLDEADLGFHPAWKKKYVITILKTIPYIFKSLTYLDEKNDKFKTLSIQIIFTTHDPLTLSDMPNNNVVFLKKDINGKTIVLDNKDKARPRKTFGANITDILSNAFFVEGGLIGDFAKQKIEEVIKWINDHKKEINPTIDRVQLEINRTIIDMIDEPVIRRKLLEMLQDLAPENKVQKIDDEMKELQERMKELKAQKSLLNKSKKKK